METYLIPCLLGLTKLVSDEVKRLGLQEVQAENGRILCRGTLADAARLNLNLRCGARVLLVLGRFPARSFEELFQGTRAIAWEDYLPENAAFPVKGYSISSQLHSVPACQSIIKKAMVERMKAHYHREQFPEDGVKYQVRFSLFKDEAALCLDTSGEGLYKRGYRAVGVEAPLRETPCSGYGRPLRKKPRLGSTEKLRTPKRWRTSSCTSPFSTRRTAQV